MLEWCLEHPVIGIQGLDAIACGTGLVRPGKIHCEFTDGI